MHRWFSSFTPVDLGELVSPRARQFARHVILNGNDAAQFTGTMRLAETGLEIVTLELKTGCGQHPAYALKRTEPLAVAFIPSDSAPWVFSTREDFPDTPHQNWVPENFPYCICIDNRNWAEASLTYTSAELLQRIFVWFDRMSKGELHGEEQPVDPNMFSESSYSLILDGDIFELPQEDINSTYHLYSCGAVESTCFFTLKRIAPNKEALPLDYAILKISIPPEKMARMRRAPNNLWSLEQLLSSRGVELFQILKDYIKALDSSRYGASLCIIIKTPMLHPKTNEIGGINTLAFLSVATVGEISEALGIAYSVPGQKKQYGLLVIEQKIAQDKIQAISLSPCPVNRDFDPDMAARLAGRVNYSMYYALLVGAGAVGSLVIESLYREGRFRLTIVDNDILLPHNLSRHSLGWFDIGHPKAQMLAEHLYEIMPVLQRPNYHIKNILSSACDNSLLSDIKSSDVIFDATASIAASRCICELDSDARRVCFFYNPSGTAAAILVEDEKRSVDLRCLEAFLYAQVLATKDIKDFWNVPVEMLPYAGDCRAVTTRLAASQVQILSGLIARDIGRLLDQPAAKVVLWSTAEDGSFNKNEKNPEQPFVALNQDGGWQVRILAHVKQQILARRMECFPNETGGSLLGIVDLLRKRVEILDIIPPPKDSIASPEGFTRGVSGLHDLVMDAIARCNNEIRYIGEWHSHPPNMRSRPSVIDVAQLSFLTSTLAEDGYPGVQIIAGADGINTILGEAVLNL